MSAKHKKLVQKAIDAIQEVFGDTSVSPHQTRESLEKIQEEVEVLVSSLEDTAEDE